MRRILAIFCAVNSEALHWQPVGLRMIRLQQWESAPYFAAFSLHIPDMRCFLHMREIVNICPRSPIVSIKPVFRYPTPKSNRPLVASGGCFARLAADDLNQIDQVFDLIIGYGDDPRCIDYQHVATERVRCHVAYRVLCHRIYTVFAVYKQQGIGPGNAVLLIVFCVELALDARPPQCAEGICDLLRENRVGDVAVRCLNTRIDAMSVIEPRACFVALESVQGAGMGNLNDTELLDRDRQQRALVNCSLAAAVGL